MALPTVTWKDATGATFYTQTHYATTAAALLTTPIVSTDGPAQTYYFASKDFAPVATPTAYILVQGSATKTIRIRKVRLTGAATAYGEMKVKLALWTTAGTAGSAVLAGITGTKADSSNSAATAVVSTVGTANYTTEGTNTLISCSRLDFGPLTTDATSSAAPPREWFFGTGGDQAIVLRGTSQYLAIGGDGDAVPSGGVIDFEIALIEESES